MPLTPAVCGKFYEFHTPTNETVQSITGCLPVSDRLKSLRLRFFGHLARSVKDLVCILSIWTAFSNYSCPAHQPLSPCTCLIVTAAGKVLGLCRRDQLRVLYVSIRGAPDPEFCDPDPNLDYCRQQEKNYSFCTTTGKAGMTVYRILWPNFYLSDN